MKLLADWRTRVADNGQRLASLGHWVKGRPELAGRHWLTPEEFRSGRLSGLSDLFHRTVVMGAVEDTILATGAADPGGAPLGQEYPPGPAGAGAYYLYWKRGALSSVITVGGSPEELKPCQQAHQTLQGKVQETEELNAVVQGYRRARELNQALAAVLESVAHLAQFPGSCELCRDLAAC